MNDNETNIISKMSIKVIGGGVYLKNRPQTITITWEIKDENGNIITPDTLSVNNIPLDPTTTSKTYHRVFSDVDFTVRAVKDGVLAIGTTTARFVGPTQTVEDSLTSNSRSIAASANSVRLLNEKIENNSSFKGLFTSLDDLKKKLRSGNNGDWAIVGEGIPAPIYIWNKNGWEATGGQYTGSTIDLDNYYTKENVANYTDDYNVSKNHSHIVKIYDLVNWKVVERKPDAPVFQLGQSYDAGEVVNMTDDNDSSYECLRSTITAPYLNQEVRSFTLAEAISFLPEDLRVTGQKISFLSSELNAWMTYVFTGGDYTNPTYWEIFTNNIDPDTNQKIADLQAKDEDLQNQINEDVQNLANHIAESDQKFEEIDNTLEEHENRMDDIEDEILLSSVEAACAPKDIEILADRAYKDHLGNIIADEYITRDTLTEEIIDITNQQVTDIKPGSIQPEDLSEAVKQMFGAKKITNLPDEEDITVTEDNTLKFKDREYSPKDYSGMGKKILRKHYIDGINTLTQRMINKPNTIYVIRYDYCLQGQTIEIPENCVLEFDGGSLRNGKLQLNDTTIISELPVFNSSLRVSGTVANDVVHSKWFYNDHKNFYPQFVDIVNLSNNSKVLIDIKKDTYRLLNNNETCTITQSIDFNDSTIILNPNGRENFRIYIRNSDYVTLDSSVNSSFEEAIESGNKDADIYKNYKNCMLDIRSNNVEIMRLHPLVDSPMNRRELLYIDVNGFLLNDLYSNYINISYITSMDCSVSSCFKNVIIKIEDSFSGEQTGGYRNIGFEIDYCANLTIENITLLDPDIENYRMCFFSGGNIYNLSMINCNLSNTRNNRTPINDDTSAYTITLGRVIEWNMDNVRVGNLIGDAWGCTGCNYIVNWRINNSKLGRIDVHHRLNNLYVDNSIIGNRGLTFSGWGVIKVNNCTFYNKAAFTPRNDYGGYFDGDIYLSNSKFDVTDKDGFIIYTDFTKFNFQPGNEQIANRLKRVGCRNLYIDNFKFSDTQCIVIIIRHYVNESTGYNRDLCISPNVYVRNCNFRDTSTQYAVFAIDYSYRSSEIFDNTYPRTYEFSNCSFLPYHRYGNYSGYANGATYSDYLKNESVIRTNVRYYNCYGINLAELGANLYIDIHNSYITASAYNLSSGDPTMGNYRIYNSIISLDDFDFVWSTAFPDGANASYSYYKCIFDCPVDTDESSLRTYYKLTGSRLYPNFRTVNNNVNTFDCRFGKNACDILGLRNGFKILDFRTVSNETQYISTLNSDTNEFYLKDYLDNDSDTIRINNNSLTSNTIIYFPNSTYMGNKRLHIIIESCYSAMTFKFESGNEDLIFNGNFPINEDNKSITLGLESDHSDLYAFWFGSGVSLIFTKGPYHISGNQPRYDAIQEGFSIYNSDLGKFLVYNKDKEWVTTDGVSTKKSGSTGSRPTTAIEAGFQYFDTTLNKPIFYTGTKWVDATGADV